MPRYYKQKIYEEEERLAIAELQKERILEEYDKDYKKYGSDPIEHNRITKERIKHSQKIALSRTKKNDKF